MRRGDAVDPNPQGCTNGFNPHAIPLILDVRLLPNRIIFDDVEESSSCFIVDRTAPLRHVRRAILYLHLVTMYPAVAVFRITQTPKLNALVVQQQVSLYVHLQDEVSVEFVSTEESVVLPRYGSGNHHTVPYFDFMRCVQHSPARQITAIEELLPSTLGRLLSLNTIQAQKSGDQQ